MNTLCKQYPTGKLCDYDNSTWHDMSECKALNTFLEKLSTSDLSDRTLVESYPIASTLLSSNSTTLTTSTIVNEEERELLFQSQIQVLKDPLLLIVDIGTHKKFILEYIMNKLSLVTTPHSQP